MTLSTLIFMNSAAANPSGDPLALHEAFRHADVVLVGWTHLTQNNFVPEAIGAYLTDPKISDHLTYAVESTEFMIDPMLRDPDYLATNEAWQRYVDVDPQHGRPWWNLLELAVRRKIKVLPLDEMRRPTEREAVDRMFATKIKTELSLGRKILVFIGDAHTEGIEYLLENTRVTTISTDYDLQTGEVSVNGKKLGQSGISTYHAKLEEVLHRGKDLEVERTRLKAEMSWVHPVAKPMPAEPSPKRFGSRLCDFLLAGFKPLRVR